MASSSVREGDLLAGKYRIGPSIGDGGMGVVVAAYDEQLERRVAIKFLKSAEALSRETMVRFLREARAAAKIESEHVVQVFDVGTLAAGAPYMVMEHLDGQDLAAWVTQKGRLPVEQAVEFLLQACEAVAEAHRLGIVHRDLKPANLFCVRRLDGRLSIKVLDFGISKLTGLEMPVTEATLTKVAAVMGSPPYMSPEQLRSAREVDARADLWSMGVILYELLAGSPPYQDVTLSGLTIKIVNDPTPSLRQLRPEVPMGLEQVIFRCLEKDRDKRYPNVAELAVALAPFGPKRARTSVERICGTIQNAGSAADAMAQSPPSAPAAQEHPAQTAASWGHTAPPPAERRRRRVLVATGASVLSALFAIALVKGQEPPAGSAKPTARGADAVQAPPVALRDRPAPAVQPSASTSATRPTADVAQPSVPHLEATSRARTGIVSSDTSVASLAARSTPSAAAPTPRASSGATGKVSSGRSVASPTTRTKPPTTAPTSRASAGAVARVSPPTSRPRQRKANLGL